jgi:hypothetical protein
MKKILLTLLFFIVGITVFTVVYITLSLISGGILWKKY